METVTKFEVSSVIRLVELLVFLELYMNYKLQL